MLDDGTKLTEHPCTRDLTDHVTFRSNPVCCRNAYVKFVFFSRKNSLLSIMVTHILVTTKCHNLWLSYRETHSLLTLFPYFFSLTVKPHLVTFVYIYMGLD